MYELPTSITIGDRQYQITNEGDYRVVLDCFRALSDSELSEDEQVLASLLIFYNEFTDLDDLPNDQDIINGLITEMCKFFNCGQEDSIGASTSQQVIDWDGDSTIIAAAINNVAHTEIRSVPYCHWWTFMGYYMSIGESVLSTVVGIRDKLNRGKELEKWEKEFKTQNPHYFNWKKKTAEQLELDEYVRNLWNNGGVL